MEWNDQDLLPAVAPLAKGLAFSKSWFYNGGFGLAGWHGEDAGMHFGHQSIALECVTDDPLVARVLEMHMKFSRKTWVMYKKPGAQGMMELNAILAQRFGEQPCTDEHLVSRNRQMDPRSITRLLGADFQVVHQYPGHLFMSGYPHQVFGGNLWSFAFNYCFAHMLEHYIRVERELASSVREQKWLLQRDRKFVLSSALAASVSYNTNPLLAGRAKDVVTSAVRGMLQVESAEEGPLVWDGLLLGSEPGLPVLPQEAQCAKCKGPIIDRVFLAISHSGRKKVICVLCAQNGQKPARLLAGNLMGLAVIRRITASQARS